MEEAGVRGYSRGLAGLLEFERLFRCDELLSRIKKCRGKVGSAAFLTAFGLRASMLLPNACDGRNPCTLRQRPVPMSFGEASGGNELSGKELLKSRRGLSIISGENGMHTKPSISPLIRENCLPREAIFCGAPGERIG